ncbi:MAG TPA: SGNH/GDSL hydrolase family protein [Micromonosporaceae bacterium]|nr:SGNH/GDSL hydrolase family protein [Micromonosporaceae bacterium]
MSGSKQVRRLAIAAAFGSGGLGAAGALLTGVVMGQAMLARRDIPLAESPPPRCDGRYGTEYAGVPIRIAMLGDSSAAGYGVEAPKDTPGALLAAGLAEQLHRPVELRCWAVVGAESRHLAPQVRRVVEQAPDVAVIMIGGNDITHRAKVPLAVRYLVEAVRALRAVGTEVVVGTCPDLGAIQPIRPPLRWLTGHWSRQMAAAQTIAAVSAGARTVSLGDLLGPVFAAYPDRMFSFDRFHPSAAGYEAVAAALLPSIIAAVTGAGDTAPGDSAGVRSLSEAAVAATRQAGTEVSAARPTNGAGGPLGAARLANGAVVQQMVAVRLAELRHRVWRRTEHPTGPVVPSRNVRLPGQQQRVPESTGEQR